MNPNALWVLFPFAFVGMWLAVATVLGMLSGWGTLAERFPDRDEAPISRIHFVSGRLGKGSDWNPWGGVSRGNCLRIDICPSGMRVASWRFFGLFEHPFFVPWEMISVEKRSMLFIPMYRFRFGHFGLSELTLWGWTFRRIESSGKLMAA